MDIVSLLPAGLTAFDGTLVSTGLVLVLALLVVLCLIIMLQGKIFDAGKKKQADEARAALERSAPAPVTGPAPAPRAATPAPAVEAGIPGEVVAAIAAAVYCLEGAGVTVRSVRRLPQPGASRRGVWGDAGVAETTRPFVW